METGQLCTRRILTHAGLEVFTLPSITHNKDDNLTALVTNLASLESIPKPVFSPIFLKKKIEM